EALANAGKHASATGARVSIGRSGGVLRGQVADDGVGGADPAAGAGLTGLADRGAALGGTPRGTNPPGAGTASPAERPCGPRCRGGRDGGTGGPGRAARDPGGDRR